MKNGYNLVRFTNIKRENSNMVKSVDYDVVAYIGKTTTMDMIIETHKEFKMCESDICMVVRVEDGEVVDCVYMLFYNKESGEVFVDYCEWDFRVYASIAFGKDLM